MAVTVDGRDGYAQAGPLGAAAESLRARAFRRARRHSLLVRVLRLALPIGALAVVAIYALTLSVGWRIGPGRLNVGEVAADRRRPDHEEPELLRPDQGGRPLRGAGQEGRRGIQQGCADQAHRCRRRPDAGQRRRHQPQGQARPARQRQERAGAVRRHRDRGHQRPEGAPVARQGVLQGAPRRLQASGRSGHADGPRAGRNHDHAHRHQGDDLRRQRRGASQGIDAGGSNDPRDAGLRPRLAPAGRRDVRAALRQRRRQDGAVHGRRGGRAGRHDLEDARAARRLRGQGRIRAGERRCANEPQEAARACRGSSPRTAR